jgi:hypothetical protein
MELSDLLLGCSNKSDAEQNVTRLTTQVVPTICYRSAIQLFVNKYYLQHERPDVNGLRNTTHLMSSLAK